MSNRFIGTFLWLDKLGLGATLGIDVIIRQTIFHDNYALIDNDYIPNPVSLKFPRIFFLLCSHNFAGLVGERVVQETGRYQGFGTI